MKLLIKLIVTLSILLLGSNGCTGSRQLKSPEVPPFLKALENWPERYVQNFAKMNYFSGKARLSVESQRFSGNVNVETHWVKPGSLAVQMKGPLGISIAKIFIGEKRFVFYNQHENYYTSGNVQDPYLNRFWSTGFTLNQLKPALIGKAILCNKPLRMQDRANGVFITEKDGIKYRYLVNTKNGLLEKCELSRNARVFIQQDFKRYRLVRGIYLPSVILVTLPDQKERITVVYQAMTMNQSVASEKYTIKISPKVKQLNLNE